MNQRLISFGGAHLEIQYPAQLSDTLDILLSKFPHSNSLKGDLLLRILEDDQSNSITVYSLSNEITSRFARDKFPEGLLSIIAGEFTSAICNRLVFRSAAIAVDDRHSIIVPGPKGSGKSILASWLLSLGYQYLTDELICLDVRDEQMECLSQPLNLKAIDFSMISKLLGDQIDSCIAGKETNLTFIKQQLTKSNSHYPSLIIFPHFALGQPLTLKPVSSAQIGFKLLKSLTNSKNIANQALIKVSSIARKIPALTLEYGSLDQLNDISSHLVPLIIDNLLTPSELIKFFTPFQTDSLKNKKSISIASSSYQPKKQEIPLPTPAGPPKRLTIGMATYDDYDGVYFSVQAIRMYHPEITDISEIIVVDNNPHGPCANDLKRLEQNIQGYRYLPFPDQSGTVVRDYIFRQSNADYVLSIDCHVLIVPGALKRLIDYLEETEDCQDLLQGPLLHDNQSKLTTHFVPRWNQGMYGVWDSDQEVLDKDADPFEIPMQGLGLFACRREAWVGFNPRFRGFGGEEGYIHEKFRKSGRKTICLPFLQWVHRFHRPMGIPYPINWDDRIHNYMVGFQELGLDTSPIKNHFRDHLGPEWAEKIIKEVEDELTSPFTYFDAIYCITLDQNSNRWKSIQQRFVKLGLIKRVRIFDAISTPESHHIGCTLSHRAIIAQAKLQGLNNVLVFEDDAIFLDNTIEHLEKSVEELKQQSWNIFYLGGHKWGQSYPFADKCNHLLRPTGLTCTHAVAYNNSIFSRVLNDIPDTIEETAEWVNTHQAIDQYLRGLDKLFLAEPVVASQPQILGQEKVEHQSRFTLGDFHSP